jgi:hypothetical protein
MMRRHTREEEEEEEEEEEGQQPSSPPRLCGCHFLLMIDEHLPRQAARDTQEDC